MRHAARSTERLEIGPRPYVVHRGASIGRWNVTAWDPQRSLAPYAVQFIDELTVHTRQQYPNRDLTRRGWHGRFTAEAIRERRMLRSWIKAARTLAAKVE